MIRENIKGITLLALVLTIVILIILSTITINFTFGDNGLIKRAEQAKDYYANDTSYTDESITNVESYLDKIISENDMPILKMSEAKRKEKFEEKTIVIDEKNNEIIVPEGFKIAEDSGNTVQQGIVIEDVSASGDVYVQGSQFVWIPVGKFIKDDKTEVEITLGRYTFDTTNGTPHLEQPAYTESNPTNYENSVVLEGPDGLQYYSEIAGEHRDGVASSGTDGLNATAKNLAAFVDSVKTNGGYYIGRYEASFASGTSVDNYKATTRVSTANSEDSMSYSSRILWNYITQLDASKVAINTYNGTSVESDLMNSYAWDTAIVYIQEATGLDYANKTSANSGSLANTGTTGDEVCKINDMASNLWEWTTEYSNRSDGNDTYPCMGRGGICFDSFAYVVHRGSIVATHSSYDVGFRRIIYIH